MADAAQQLVQIGKPRKKSVSSDSLVQIGKPSPSFPIPKKGERARRPPWLRVKVRQNETFDEVSSLVEGLKLNTVCEEARCPNIWECTLAKKVGASTSRLLSLDVEAIWGYIYVSAGEYTPRYLDTAQRNSYC